MYLWGNITMLPWKWLASNFLVVVFLQVRKTGSGLKLETLFHLFFFSLLIYLHFDIRLWSSWWYDGGCFGESSRPGQHAGPCAGCGRCETVRRFGWLHFLVISGITRNYVLKPISFFCQVMGGEGPGPSGERKGGRALLPGWPPGTGMGQQLLLCHGRASSHAHKPHPWPVVLLTQITLKPNSAMTESNGTNGVIAYWLVKSSIGFDPELFLKATLGLHSKTL